MNRWGWLSAVVVLALAMPAHAQARDFAIESFDGTRIQAHFYPAATVLSDQRAPTVLYGPGWGSAGTTNPDKATNDGDGTIGLGSLRRGGYNVLTWDPRGFGNSGGEAKLNSPYYEARDVQKLIDALATMPEAKLDGAGDPRVGMAGASYGGGIQWVTAAVDSRIDAITPGNAWHSLVTSLYKDGAFKAGWGGYLCGLGAGGGVSAGLVNPEGINAGSMDEHMYSICQSGLATGRLFAGDRAWLEERGPGEEWTQKVRAPALILHGAVDTLFTLDEADRNFRILRANGVPVRMMWFCGGHGICRTAMGLSRYLESAVLRWFSYHLKNQRLTITGPRFEWIDQHGGWYAMSDYPPASDGTLGGTGAGTLQLTAGDSSSSGTTIGGTPAVNGIDVEIARASQGEYLLGAPELELDYTGQGTAGTAHVFAQLVDRDRNIVVGGQVTPIPLTLDGQPHTIRRNLERVAHVIGPGSDLVLQVIPATNVYGQQRVTATVEFARIAATLPLGRDPFGSDPPPPAEAKCEPQLSPRSAKRRKDGRVRLRPRISCGGTALDLRLSISDGLRTWSRRTGSVSFLRVRRRATKLVVRFSYEGRAYKAAIVIAS